MGKAVGCFEGWNIKLIFFPPGWGWDNFWNRGWNFLKNITATNVGNFWWHGKIWQKTWYAKQVFFFHSCLPETCWQIQRSICSKERFVGCWLMSQQAGVGCLWRYKKTREWSQDSFCCLYFQVLKKCYYDGGPLIACSLTSSRQLVAATSNQLEIFP